MSIFGVWMWPQSVSVLGAERVAGLCAQIGITDIYFLTKGLAGTVSYHSALAPRCNERDLLAELLEAAHARNIRVHAWLTSASDEHYKERFPQSGRCHYTRGKDKGLIALTDEAYIAYMKEIVTELCQGYAIDGLHLDYIRYNHLLYGWSDEDQARYAAAGADIAHLREMMDRTFLETPDADANCIFDAYRAGDSSAHALARVRREDVRRFAKTLTACARAQRSNLILSAALMPEGAYDDATFAALHYGQNYEDAAALYDVLLPMAYSQAYEKDGQWVRSVAEGTSRFGKSTVMGLHAYDGGTGPSLAEDIRALKDAKIEGICLFRFGAFALAVADGSALRLINTLEKPITAVTAGGESLLPPGTDVMPGCEVLLPQVAATHALRVFSGDTEACIYIP